MNKIIVVIIAALTILMINNTAQSEEIVIPNDAIRIRVIANSNSSKDQEIKSKTREILQTEVQELLKSASTVEEVRSILNEHLEDIHITVEKVLTKNKVDPIFNINYGLNYFPEKEFKGVIYEEGYYESIVVTIGEGKGDNWWCVLFPPLCLMETEEENIEEVEYKSFIKETLDRIF